MKTSLSSFFFPKSCPNMPEFSRSCEEQETPEVSFSQIYSWNKTEVIMTEIAGRERGEWGCHPAILFTSKTMITYEWNEHTADSDSRLLTKYLNLIKPQTNPDNW